MKCEEIFERLDELADGSLPASERRAFEEHVGSCLTCRRDLSAWRALLAEARSLPTEATPRRDLWPGLAARLGLPAVPRRGPAWPVWRRYAAAAALIAALAIGWRLGRTGPATPAAPEVAPAPATTTFAAAAEVARSEDRTLGAKLDLLEVIARHRDELSPETVAVLEENLRLIEEAIGEIRTAIDDDPANPRLRHRLAEKYRLEARLLQQVSGLS